MTPDFIGIRGQPPPRAAPSGCRPRWRDRRTRRPPVLGTRLKRLRIDVASPLRTMFPSTAGFWLSGQVHSLGTQPPVRDYTAPPSSQLMLHLGQTLPTAVRSRPVTRPLERSNVRIFADWHALRARPKTPNTFCLHGQDFPGGPRRFGGARLVS